MHQSGPRILLSVTNMHSVNQVCHGLGRCVKDGVVLRQTWVKVNGQYYWDILLSQQM